MGSNHIKLIKPQNLQDFEIEKYQDFDMILNRKTGFQNWFQSHKIIFFAGILLIIFISISILNYVEPKQIHLPVADDFISGELNSSITSASTNATLIKASVEQNRKPQETESNVIAGDLQSSSAATPKVAERPELSKFENAAPVDGFEILYQYFSQNLRYPQEAVNDSIEGIVKLKFTVRSDSTITDISVVETVTEYFNLESIRLIENMPPWKPAIYNGNPVDKEFIIPIRFNIQ